jgi:decaprenyl-phosphate phosphoribosyltransferase
MQHQTETVEAPPADGSTGTATRPGSRLYARLPLVRALRPRQWVKGLLVLGAPLASGRMLEHHVLLGSLVAMVLFCTLASSVYLLNDVRDAERDRLHPAKRFRPVAAGQLSERTALLVAVPLGVGSVALGFAWAVPLGMTLLAYLCVQVAYAYGLKDQPALDLAAVSSGFLLRAVAGGTATDLPLSPWFLLVAAFGSLFMVAGKRYSEIRRLGAEAGTRRSLQQYSESYLRFIWTMAAGVSVVVYSLWALTGWHHHASAGLGSVAWGPLSVAPFVLGLLRYAADIDQGRAESPEEIALTDRHLQVVGLVWVVTLVLHATLG